MQGLQLHPSPARRRLAALEKEHERLLADIRKKRLAREANERAARDVARAFDARLGPLRDALGSTLAELRSLFASVLGEESPLSRREKARVRRTYGLLLSHWEEPEAPSGARVSEASARGRERRGASAEAEAGDSAPKPPAEAARSLRAVFRRLALTLHPDKAQCPEERAALTDVMKEVTRAYERADLARLVELERTWLSSGALHEREEDLAARTAAFLDANQALRRQLRALNAELKALKDEIAGAFGRSRRADPRSNQWAGEMLHGELERELLELQTLRDFTRGFLRGDVSLTEFLLGPPAHPGEELDPSEPLLADALGGLEWWEACSPRAACRSASGRRRSRPL